MAIALPPRPPPTREGKAPFTPPNSSLTCETSFRVWGDISGSKIPLICLHGGPGSPSQYLSILHLLHTQYSIPVVLYDQVGCGESSPLLETSGDVHFWTMDLFLAELDNLIEHLQIKEYNLFGHSWGGVIVTQFLLSSRPHPGLYKAILSGSPAKMAMRVQNTDAQQGAIAAELAAPGGAFEGQKPEASPELFSAMIREFYKRHMCRLDPLPSDLAEGMAASREKANPAKETLYGRSLKNAEGTRDSHCNGTLKDYDAEGELHRITDEVVPGGMLLLYGGWEGANREVMRPFADKITARREEFEFERSGHFVFWEETENFMEVVARFLRAE